MPWAVCGGMRRYSKGLMMKKKHLFCIVIILLFCLGCVQPQRFNSLENRVVAMEMENNRGLTRQKLQQDIETLEKRFDQNPSITREEYAEFQDNIQVFKTNFQRLEGLIEEINHRFEQFIQKDKQALENQLDQLDHAISKNYEKIIKLEKYMGFEPSTENASQSDPELEKKLKKNTEQGLYDFAKKLFDDGEKENARIQFENFINKYPDSDNSDNAQFWIADSYYDEKWFEKAILEYQKVLEKYPNSNKLVAARLKQGYAFAELGEKANARLMFQELLKKHPDSKEAQYAQKKLKTLK